LFAHLFASSISLTNLLLIYSGQSGALTPGTLMKTVFRVCRREAIKFSVIISGVTLGEILKLSQFFLMIFSMKG
jgi:hypothetical protein